MSKVSGTVAAQSARRRRKQASAKKTKALGLATIVERGEFHVLFMCVEDLCAPQVYLLILSYPALPAHRCIVPLSFLRTPGTRDLSRCDSCACCSKFHSYPDLAVVAPAEVGGEGYPALLNCSCKGGPGGSGRDHTFGAQWRFDYLREGRWDYLSGKEGVLD